jgi:hypothetical protein
MQCERGDYQRRELLIVFRKSGRCHHPIARHPNAQFLPQKSDWLRACRRAPSSAIGIWTMNRIIVASLTELAAIGSTSSALARGGIVIPGRQASKIERGQVAIGPMSKAGSMEEVESGIRLRPSSLPEYDNSPMKSGPIFTNTCTGSWVTCVLDACHQDCYPAKPQ